MADPDIVQPIIIKKVKQGDHGHHGGAWKVAYADFVTAMMAFFLLLWLLNATTEEQKMGLADFFSPASVSDVSSGAGSVLGGQTISVDGAQVSAGGPSEGGATVPIPPADAGKEVVEGNDAEPEVSGASEQAEGEPADAETIEKETIDELLARREQEQFEAAEEALHAAIESVPELEQLQESLLIEQTPEGLRIQLIDQSGLSMFASGSAVPNEQLIKLIGLVSAVITQLPNKISVSGHTDSVPYHAANGYTNWELSSDRANAARRLLTNAGLEPQRIANVQGRAATEPLVAEDPADARNRRIGIVLLRENTLSDASLLGPGSEPLFRDEQELRRDAAPIPGRPTSAPAGAPARDARTLNLDGPG